jgi:superfamily I DNA/RNA helicase
MLKMILDDTTIPKIFVGDPMQAIYQFRGCINGFNYMPKHALIVEFYSTFRVGDPACEEIRKRFNNCWMITKSKNNTHIVDSMKGANYVYLFRTWRYLLQSAQTISDIWIHGFEKKIQMIRKLHVSLSRFGNSINDEEFEDDLPQFLKSITSDALEELIENIEDNLVEKDKAVCKMYTVHAYKGLEDNNIRIAHDNVDNDKNIEYVSLTRGKELIMIDDND